MAVRKVCIPVTNKVKKTRNRVDKDRKVCRLPLCSEWGCSSVVEHVPFKHRADGSIPSILMLNAPLAQLVEQLTLNQRAVGSSPTWCIFEFLVIQTTG